jgi:hypothetical protein
MASPRMGIAALGAIHQQVVHAANLDDGVAILSGAPAPAGAPAGGWLGLGHEGFGRLLPPPYPGATLLSTWRAEKRP